MAGVSYLAGGAERLPLRAACVDLVTVGAAFHWFDQVKAFAELARVLRSGGALVVYSDFFQGRLAGRPGFTDWLTNSYLPAFPTPARHAYFDPAVGASAGFGPPTYDESAILVALTCEELADYMLSQSNVVAALESGRSTADSLRNQILDGTREFFPHGAPVDVVFGIRVWTTVLGGDL